MQAIVICTVGNKGISVLLESIKQYGNDVPIYISGNDLSLFAKVRDSASNICVLPNTSKNFGDAYNVAADYAFRHGKFESIILANDDVVITPTTMRLLQDDIDIIGLETDKIGFVGARSDYVLHDQNIRFPVSNDQVSGLRYTSEQYIKETDVIAPIFACISKKAWDVAKFPSTNWYSDNIICSDMQKAGYRHFVSRAYVHHAGSQTVGADFNKCHEEPREWIKANRPDMYEVIYG